MDMAQNFPNSSYLFSFATGSPFSTILPGAVVVSEATMDATSKDTKGGDQTVLILKTSFTATAP